MREKNKMYLVKREVMAKDIGQAMIKGGKIYSIEEAENQPIEKPSAIGFTKQEE